MAKGDFATQRGSNALAGCDFVEFSGLAGDDAGIEMRLTSAHPYVHWSPFQGLGVWGSVGLGRGGARLTDEKGVVDTGISMRLTALGARRELMPVGRFDLAIKADAFLVQMAAEEHADLPGVAADASRMRLAPPIFGLLPHKGCQP